MISEVTIKITMTEGAFTTPVGDSLQRAGGETIPPPPQDVEGVSEMEVRVWPVPQDVSEGFEGDIAAPAVPESGKEDIAVPPLPQEASAESTEGYLSKSVPPGEEQRFGEDELYIPPVPEED